MTNEELMALAKEARERSYSPYSGFAVGAALLTQDGKVYLGCNIENSSFSPTNCAERTAFFTAVANGDKKFSAIAICGGKSGEETIPCAPCGVCRQVMNEFCDKDFIILLENEDHSINELTLSTLLPYGFEL